jgi:hypothetical protein
MLFVSLRTLCRVKKQRKETPRSRPMTETPSRDDST